MALTLVLIASVDFAACSNPCCQILCSRTWALFTISLQKSFVNDIKLQRQKEEGKARETQPR